jgi:dihydrodipicolinate synthase/N-acetylneuraminate lyase
MSVYAAMNRQQMEQEYDRLRVMFDAYKEQKLNLNMARGKPAKMQLDAIPLINALFCEVNPIPVKMAANLMGMEVGGLRMPLTDMTPKNTEVLAQAMRDFGIKLA